MKPVDDGCRIGSLDAKTRSSRLQVSTLNRIEVEGIPALRVGEGIGFSLKFRQPPSEPTRSRAARDEPRLTSVAPPGAGKVFPELFHSYPVIRKANVGTGGGIGFNLTFDIVWCGFVTHDDHNACRTRQVSNSYAATRRSFDASSETRAETIDACWPKQTSKTL